MKINRLLLAVLSALLAGQVWIGTAIATAVQDSTPPVITHTAISSAYSDANLIIRAKVTDASPVDRVVVFFRTQGTVNYYSMNMMRVGSEFRAAISASYMQSGMIEYYIQATDAAGNSASFPADVAVTGPQTVIVRKDNTIPLPELIEPTGSVSGNGFAVFIVFRDLAGNVNPKSIRVFYNDNEVTDRAHISETGVSYQVPGSDVTLRSRLTVEAADLAGNRVKRSFAFWKAADWSREFRVDAKPGADYDARLDMSMGWGPLYLSTNLRDADPFFTKLPGQPDNKFELRYDARLMHLALGDTTSSLAPLALDSLSHRGGDLKLRLGPLSVESVYGFPRLSVEDEDYQRKVLAIRPAFTTGKLDMALSLVKVRDEWSEATDIAGINPEVNYVLDAQVGLATFGGRAGVDVEGALSLYHDNARGDLWSNLEGLSEALGDIKGVDQVLAKANNLPQEVKDFFELPDIQYGLPKVDIGAQATARLPLPWSQVQAKVYHFGRDFQTIAGSGDSNAQGATASYNTIRLLNALQVSADCERRVDTVKTLLETVLEMAGGDDDTAEPTRTAYNSCAAKVSMGPAGRFNLDLGAKYADEAPLGNALTEYTNDYTAELRNIRFGLLGAGVRLGAAAGLTQLDVMSDPSADKDTQVYKLTGGLDLGSWSYDAAFSEKKELDADGKLQVTNPSIDGSITWTLRKPRLLFFTPQDLRFRLSANMDNSNDAFGNRISGKKGIKVETDTRLTAGVRLNGMWQKQASDTVTETKWSTSFRWRF